MKQEEKLIVFEENALMEKKYMPISCSFYDELEALATLKQKTIIHYLDAEGQEVTIETKILDFYIEQKVEYMKIEDGKRIRLDHLIKVNDKVLTNYC